MTGKLDKETVELMGTPRCGVQDVLEEQLVDEQEILDVGDKEEENVTSSYFPARRKRYALQGSRWRTKSLTYKVNRQTKLQACNQKGYNRRNLVRGCSPALKADKVTK